MKTTLFSFLLCISSLAFAQFDPVTDESFGTFTPLFQYQGNLFVRQNIDDLDTSDTDYQYYKINVSTNAVTQLTVTESAKPYFENGYWASVINNGHANPVFAPQYYGNMIYFRIQVGNQVIVKINTQTNVLDIIDPSIAQGIGVQLFNDRLYYGNSGNDNYPNGWIELPDETIIPSSNWFDATNAYTYGNNLFMSYKSEENNWYFANFDNLQYEKLLLPTADNGSYIIPQGFHPKLKPFVTNNRLLYHDGYGGKIISFSVDDILDNNYNILDLSEYQLNNYILLNDGAIFHTKHYDTETQTSSHKWYKTDGVNNAAEIGYIPTFSQWGYLSEVFQTYSDWNNFIPVSAVGNSFVQIGNVTYFSTFDSGTGVGGDYTARIYKMTSINTIPELIYTAQTGSNASVKYAIEWQENLIFYDEQENVIYTYNGTELYIDPQLNTFNGRGTIEEEDEEISGIFSMEDYLAVRTETGLYKIHEEDQQSTTEQELSQIKIYPNPTKDYLNFSEKVKEITVYDLSGKLVKTQKDFTERLNVNDLPKGNYILTGTAQSGNKIQLKFIKQ